MKSLMILVMAVVLGASSNLNKQNQKIQQDIQKEFFREYQYADYISEDSEDLDLDFNFEDAISDDYDYGNDGVWTPPKL